jgi:hypothetical protein
MEETPETAWLIVTLSSTFHKAIDGLVRNKELDKVSSLVSSPRI